MILILVKNLRMSFKCRLVIRTIAGTIDICFNNFQNFVKYTNSPFILVWTGYSKIETQYIRKNYWRIFKIWISSAAGI